MKKLDIIVEAYLLLKEANIMDSSVDDDSDYHIFDQDKHDAMKKQFTFDRTHASYLDLNNIPLPIHGIDSIKHGNHTLYPHYAGSFGLHIDSAPSDYKKQNKSFIKFHSIHKDHAFITEEKDGNYKIHSDYSKPIEFSGYRTHGLIPKDTIKKALKISGKKYAKNPEKNSLHNPNKVSAVFSVTEI